MGRSKKDAEMSESEKLKRQVFEAVEAYCAATHDFSFDGTSPIVRLHEPTFSADEINAALDCMLTTQVTMGAKVKSFEKAFCMPFGHGNGVMSNSGSSANLLAIAVLANPDASDALCPGDEVIVPALSWSTTVWPLIQLGLVPVVVDIDPKTLNIDPNAVENAIGPKTRGVMIVHVYGNPCDMDAISAICANHELVLIEDCCEALGASFGESPVGSFGRVATFSFYFSHHMTTFEGGITIAQGADDAELMRILRAHGWIREVEDQERWRQRYPNIHPRFLFVNLGYNLRATELQGAMGMVQLPKLDGYVSARRTSAQWLLDRLERHLDVLQVQSETAGGDHSWFGFPITISANAPFDVDDITTALNRKGIETRPIICGNIARQPGLQMYPHRVHGDLTHSDAVMARGFSFGNHQDIDSVASAYIADAIDAFLEAL